jgi:hypothetical protein
LACPLFSGFIFDFDVIPAHFSAGICVSHCSVEGELPEALVESKTGFAAYGLGLAALEISLSSE